ncbi:MAG TPA: Mut7-C RNAse domain-containing protein, partial [Candidatus Eisenbacteria bacterium]|nr:Mut7-C RNAse domain-containing protein [Candidatus Eisenbacteria bacterium]
MPERFVADHALERLAQRLRLAGYDVRSARGARLDELYEVAAREDRIVLTPSHRHPARFGAVPAVVVPREDVRAALRVVAGRYQPGGPSFSRCLLCNTSLERRHAIEAAGEVPGRVTRTFRELSHCPTCGRWYWEGTHVARLRAWLVDALGAGATGDG